MWSFTGTRPAPEPWPNRVVPDGCLDILYDLRRGTASVVGPMTRAVIHRIDGPIDLVGIRFRPGGAAPLLGPGAAELRDRVAAVRDVVPRWRDVSGLSDRLLPLSPVGRRRAVLEAVSGWVAEATDPDSAVLEAGRMARATGGRATVGRLAERVGLTRRTLERRFAAAVGLAPKFALRVERFREVRRLLTAAPSADLSSLAFRTGYADQSHMTRDVTGLAGIPPARWAAERERVAFVQDGERAEA